MGKKKTKKKKAARRLAEEAEDEVLALAAIFSDDFREGDDSFVLRVMPHPGEAEANFVSVELVVRYPHAYPRQPVQLQLQQAQGLSAADVKALAARLQATAATRAAQHSVAVFDLVEEAQELLRQLNAPPSEPQAPAAASASEPSFSIGNPRAHAWAGADLFADAPAAGDWRQSPLLLSPVGRRHNGTAPAAALAARTDGLAGRGEAAALGEVPPEDAPISPFARRPWEDGQGLATVRPPGGVDLQDHAAAGRLGSSLLSGLVQGISAVGRAVGAAALPRAVRRLLTASSSDASRAGSGGLSDASEPASASGEAAAATPEEADALRRDLLAGHLLRLACGGGSGGSSVLRDALPELAAHLAAAGLLPRWLPWVLVQQESVFDRAFQRAFKREVQAASGGESSSDPRVAWAVEQFWLPPAARGAAASGLAAASGGPAAAQHRRGHAGDAPQRAPSRYEADFAELRLLGRGGFGVVVAAVNRLDGRAYAIKKIRVDAGQPVGYARILREVATLSRLQHPHVVRYFQAWCEMAAPGGLGLASSDDSSGWPLSSTLPTPAAAPPHADAEADAPLGPWSGLMPVVETSGEGLSSGGAGGVPTAAGGRAAAAASGSTAPSSGAGGWWRRAPGSSADGGSSSAGSSSGSGGSASGDAASGTSGVADAAAPLTARALPPQARADGRTEGQAPGQGRAQEVLYIQMEYCPRTVKDVLDAGRMDDASAWKVVRQVAAGLSYIHAQGIIHRDLKPANLFYDARGDIKLGDFGLAKFSTGGAVVAQEEAEETGEASDGGRRGGGGPSASDATGMVGTSFYIAPEIRDGWASYDAKVDLYSLGVVVFELWHPFSTGMERIRCLEQVSQGRLPEAWQRQHPQVAALVRWLLALNPAERPSAREALRSPLLPAAVGDEQLADLLRGVDDDVDTFERVVDHLFASASSRVKEGGLRLEEMAGAPDPAARVPAVRAVCEAIDNAFGRHGAVQMASNLIGCLPAASAPDAVRMMGPGGEVVAMAYEMRAPFAAWLAKQAADSAGGAAAECLRRYEVGPVMRPALSRSLPRAYLQADLDLLLPLGAARGGGGEGGAALPADAMLTEAEVIKAVCGVLDALPDVARYEVRISHRTLAEAALHHIGLPPELRASALSLLSTASSVSPAAHSHRAARWPAIQKGLQGLGVSSNAIARCRQMALSLPGEVGTALSRLTAFFRDLGYPATAPVFGALRSLARLVEHLGVWGIGGEAGGGGAAAAAAVVLDPLLPPHADYYSGLLFQLQVVQSAQGSCSLVAAGGRYDALLRSAWRAARPQPSGPPPGAVGATINVERLVALLPPAPHGGAGRALPPASSADVLVCSRGGGGLLRERMRLLQELWAAGIKAELVPSASPSLTEQYEYAYARNMGWLVILANAPERRASDTVRVKALRRGSEETVPLEGVAKYLAAAVQQQAARYVLRVPSREGGGRGGDEDGAAREAGDEKEHGSFGRRRRGGRERG